MSTETLTLLSNNTTEASVGVFSYTGKQKGAGYHRYNDGVHTVVYDLKEFVGTIKIQATLSLYPDDNSVDWFDVDGTEHSFDSTVSNGAYSYTFTGRFMWVRAAYNLQDGTIVEIRYNY